MTDDSDLVALFARLHARRPRSMRQIAASTGLSRSYISEVRSGKKRPSPQAAEAIASAFGAGADDLELARQYATAVVPVRTAKREPSARRQSAGRWVLPALGPVVERPELTEQLIGLLQAQEPSAIAAAVVGTHGTGGFGKTTLAKYVCRDQRLPAAFPGGLLWVTLGEHVHGVDLAQRVNELVEQLTGQKPTFSDPEQAGRRLGVLLDECPGPVLLVIDDVWTEQQLDAFRHGGGRCVRLVTTRNRWLVPTAATVTVDQMTPLQADQMLRRDVPALPDTVVEELVAATGCWPVVLNLVNRAVYRSVARGLAPGQAAGRVLERLRRIGPAALDLDTPEHRSQAVEATVRYGLDLLPAAAEDRFLELAVFSEYREIPRSGLDLLWAETGDLDADGVEQMCEALADLSLLDYRPEPGTVHLHDVLRDYVAHRFSVERTAAGNRALLDAAAGTLTGHDGTGRAWWTLPRPYDPVFARLAGHLTATGQDGERAELVNDLRWVEAAIHRHGPGLVERDGAEVIARAVRQSAHLLVAAAAGPSLGAVLVSRLSSVPELRSQVDRYEATQRSPRMVNKWPIPDQPHPALVRTIVDKEHEVWGILAAIPGGRLATLHEGGLVRVWDIDTGELRHTLDVGWDDDHLSVASGSSGAWLAIGGLARIQIRDLATGRVTQLIDHDSQIIELVAVVGHDLLAALEEDGHIGIFETSTGKLRHRLTSTDGRAVQICGAGDGGWLAVLDDRGNVAI